MNFPPSRQQTRLCPAISNISSFSFSFPFVQPRITSCYWRTNYESTRTCTSWMRAQIQSHPWKAMSANARWLLLSSTLLSYGARRTFFLRRSFFPSLWFPFLFGREMVPKLMTVWEKEKKTSSSLFSPFLPTNYNYQQQQSSSSSSFASPSTIRQSSIPHPLLT